jgi:ComF family protein
MPSGILNCCAGCRRDLPWINAACQRCGDILPAEYNHAVCGHCGDLAPAIARIVSALVYEYPVDRLIARAKFQRRIDMAHALGELLANFLLGQINAGEIVLPEMIVPVPLHPRRAAQRGFNQAIEIARPLARQLRVLLDTKACRRIRNTAEQTRIEAAERPRNTRGAFHASKNLKGINITIIDDVITTGSTVNALAEALGNAGAWKIQIWTVARSVKPAVRHRPWLAAGSE